MDGGAGQSQHEGNPVGTPTQFGPVDGDRLLLRRGERHPGAPGPAGPVRQPGQALTREPLPPVGVRRPRDAGIGARNGHRCPRRDHVQQPCAPVSGQSGVRVTVSHRKASLAGVVSVPSTVPGEALFPFPPAPVNNVVRDDTRTAILRFLHEVDGDIACDPTTISAMPTQVTEAAEHLPTTAELVVIGGGILGAATALNASRRGLRVVVVERGKRLGGLTTQASAGGYRLQFDTPEEIALLKESLAFWDAFPDQVGDATADLRRTVNGYLWVTRRHDRVASQQAQVAHQLSMGVDGVEWLNGDDARRRFPYLAEDVAGVRYRAGDGWIDPVRATVALAEGASRHGVLFVFNTAVTGFGTDNGRVTSVITDQGDIACDYAIVAAGPFTGHVLSLAGINLPISPRIRQRLVLPDAPEVPSNAPMTIDEDTGSHWRPEGGGAYVLRPDPTAPSGPPAIDPPASREFYDLLLDPDSEVAVAKHASFWRNVWARRTQHWYVTAGQYSYSPDHMPLLGPTAIPNLGVNGGYSGHGIMASPAGSRIAVDTLLGLADNETNPFRASRDFNQHASEKPPGSGGHVTGIGRGPL